MRTTSSRSPTLAEDIGALADLYVGVFRMMNRRFNPKAPKPQFPALPEELCPPPLPNREVQERELVGHR